MSEVYTAFKNSSAWDKEHDLPLCPGNGNPWIYGAYCMKIMKSKGLTPSEEMVITMGWRRYADKCRIEPGLFNRWPGKDNWTSHDELMGMVYVLPELGKEILKYLDEHEGVYTNNPADAQRHDKAWAFNIYRFVFVAPYLRAATGYYVDPISQLIFAGHLLNDIRITRPGMTSDAGGRLRNWLMLEAMSRFWITGLAGWHWKNKMSAMGYTPANQLKIEPGEHPILAEYAPGSF